MAPVLDSLRPLVSLLRQASAPIELAERLTQLSEAGRSGALVSALAEGVTDARLAVPTLTYAGVLGSHEDLTPVASLRLAQAQVLLEAAADDRWELILTVPPFLRTVLRGIVDKDGIAARPRETSDALSEIANAATTRLIIAAPYLQAELIHTLIRPIERLVTTGGQVMVITRALSLHAPERSTANLEAVTVLRETARHAGQALIVRSWEESGLGIHFKVVIADTKLAYLGSANLTRGGLNDHAEAGVLLRGRRVHELARWLTAVAEELDQR